MHGDSFEQLEPGQLIAERYRIEERIGQGAMGSVWRALHVRLESPVAVKILRPSIANDAEMLERFLREARSAAAVRSSHVVQIFDYGVDGELPYIAMELLVGETLEARLAARRRLEPPELDGIFREIARAVGNAHDLGVVHRDLKPANIFIAREGGHELTKVLDFGIAKLVDAGLAAPVGSGTHTGNLLGTPLYMSPEQARGRRHVDQRSDLWAMAVVAFECLTGKRPFEGNSLGDIVVKICTAPAPVPSSLANLPPSFDAWFSKGVSKDPDARFRSASEMADELHALLAAEGLSAESRPGSSAPALAAPPRAAARDAAGAGPQRTLPLASPGATRSSTTEPSITTAGAVSTEVLHPAAQARRRRGLAIAAGLIAASAAVVALGPGKGLLQPGRAGGALGGAATPVPSAGSAGPRSSAASAAASAGAPASTTPPAGTTTAGTAPADVISGTPAPLPSATPPVASPSPADAPALPEAGRPRATGARAAPSGARLPPGGSKRTGRASSTAQHPAAPALRKSTESAASPPTRKRQARPPAPYDPYADRL